MFYTLYLHSPPKGLFLYMITYLIYIIFILLISSFVLLPIFLTIERYDLAIKIIKVVLALFLILTMLTYI